MPKRKIKEVVVVEREDSDLSPPPDDLLEGGRKTKAEKEAELVSMPLAPRTLNHTLFIGAHISSAGGVHNSPLNAVQIGANAFALFLKSQRKWTNPDLQDEHCSTFHARCKDHAYDQAKYAVPHGSYLVNLAHTEKARTEQAYDAFLDDLRRCERLGIKLYNFHPGNVQCHDRGKAIAHLAANLDRAHAATAGSGIITLLENMAAGGNVLGSTFEDLRDIIALTTDKSRVGVCLDTCHAFAAGYDLRSPTAFAATMSAFDSIVGLRYLRAMHINDSKAPFASHKDLHANIGTGFLGLRAFHNIVNFPPFAGLPLILETPIDVRDDEGKYIKEVKGKAKTEVNVEDKSIWAREIKLLESLVGMDVEGEEFLMLEGRLARQGEPERRRLVEQIERVREKKERLAKSPRRKRKKNGEVEAVVDGEVDGAGEEEGESELSELEEEEIEGLDSEPEPGDGDETQRSDG
ncbi:hypothetical protein BAUCODRAFT_109370 [Baudoinia panamericana UAMH 10762]|uniref:Apurinic-apyrimidinic endonuclease 1 n=1 Tax=Baudoinia panamericana (strain UAMH 10762) TaxID=717646 RepID=M2NA96_BAUPA|nr:uncharacterized protein BAUCODRAFT_109370 [Baudoinia panamericana UAMH 10762]EMC95780.1 hypothetical protein BAUCODRAFT_109370 [Baudoinia panamericana UAMH 10762]